MYSQFTIRWLVITALLVAASQTHAGQLTYPALGNIDFEQGTIEMWLVPQFDPHARIDGSYWGRRFFRVSQDGDNHLSLMWRVTASEDAQAGGPYVTGRSEGDRFTAFTQVWHRVGKDDDGWEQGQAKHVAFCWDGNELWWIVNGQETRRAPMRLPFTIRPNEELEIVLGHKGDNPFVIRDLRISSIPRQPEELGYHHPGGLEPDPWTLLLDPLNESFEIDGEQQTRPRVMMPAPNQSGGLPSKDCRFIETEAGTGLNL